MVVIFIGLVETCELIYVVGTMPCHPSGIYRCDIPTGAVHDDIDLSVRETVYVGLYVSGGISQGMQCRLH